MYFQNRARPLPLVWQCVAILAMSAVVGLAANHLRTDGLPLVGDWSPRAQLTIPDSEETLAITLQEAETLFFAQEAVFVDARPEALFRQGHIEGARNLPWSDFDAMFSDVMADVLPESPIITYCDGEGCTLSKEVALALMDRGYPRVHVLVNGWTVWQDAGLPIVQ